MFNVFNIFRKKPISTSKIDYEYYYSNKVINGISLKIFQPGTINITSGKIIACDPLTILGNAQCLNKVINPGKYPVLICIASNKEIGERYSLVKIVIKDEVVVRWEFAYTKSLEHKIANLKEDEFFGFPVDTGLGCFCDFYAQESYKRFIENTIDENGNIYDDYFAEKFKINAIDKNNPKDIGNWLDWKVPHTENNVIMFNSGFGDGVYPAYWGINQKGKVISLLIDFLVFQEKHIKFI